MLDRRSSLAAMMGMAVAPAVRAADGGGPRDNFELAGTFMNAAYTHPLPRDAAAAMRAYLAGRVDPFAPHPPRPDAKAKFARLVNAAPEEIAFVPSTSYGEDFVVAALGLKGQAPGAIVTDILHFEGSLYMYGELAKRGRKVTVLPMTRAGAVDLNRLEAAVAGGTRLVAISLVSMINGFQHDLKAVCDIAHRRGALVYVDAIQAVGAVPVDVRASGVDFLACSSFKWLQGEFGYGFLYARGDLIPKLARFDFGYHQMASYDYHLLPGDPPGPVLFEATPDDRTAMGRFEIGSAALAAEAAVAVSLDTLLATGVDRIQRERQPLIDTLRARLERRYRPLTPAGTRSPIIAFAMPDAAKTLRARMTAAHINIQLYPNRFRISPSVYNDAADVDRVVDMLMA